jgi:hypothetical protein
MTNSSPTPSPTITSWLPSAPSVSCSGRRNTRRASQHIGDADLDAVIALAAAGRRIPDIVLAAIMRRLADQEPGATPSGGACAPARNWLA